MPEDHPSSALLRVKVIGYFIRASSGIMQVAVLLQLNRTDTRVMGVVQSKQLIER